MSGQGQTEPAAMPWEWLYSDAAILGLSQCGGLPQATTRPPQDTALDRLRAALQHPIAPSPPLHKIVVPGDRVVIPLETGMRDAAECVAAVVSELQLGGVDPDHISVLRSDKETRLTQHHAGAALDERVREAITWLTHHRHQREDLAYLASTQSDHRVYVHRALTEADVVVPIGTIRPLLGTQVFSTHSSWFPRFSDAETWDRFRPQTPKSQEAHHQLAAEADEVAWLLGNQFQLQVLAGGGDALHEAWAGRPQELAQVGPDRYAATWNCPLPKRVPFAIAEITGGRAEQTWSNVARVLWQAQDILEDGGTLALCSRLRSAPLRDIQPLLRREDWSRVIGHEGTRGIKDSLLMEALVHATENWRVYLLSQLPEHTVESLHLIHVAAPSEIARLATRQPGGLFWRNAQYARPFVPAETPTSVPPFAPRRK